MLPHHLTNFEMQRYYQHKPRFNGVKFTSLFWSNNFKNRVILKYSENGWNSQKCECVSIIREWSAVKT